MVFIPLRCLKETFVMDSLNVKWVLHYSLQELGFAKRHRNQCPNLLSVLLSGKQNLKRIIAKVWWLQPKLIEALVSTGIVVAWVSACTPVSSFSSQLGTKAFLGPGQKSYNGCSFCCCLGMFSPHSLLPVLPSPILLSLPLTCQLFRWRSQ